ncbi:MAG: hypothetical protein B6244_00730 [Candidatus Cloacimonetes bacterium 4572_55]|nr:MAG: hypothetical protein B6244_00730 [Candidatus Cloacimonetes bacterium 4572_55]
MLKRSLVEQLKSANKYFLNSTRCLNEEDSAFAPKEGMFTVAQQVAHTAQIIDWFFEGAFRPEGFSVDFEGLTGEILKCESLAGAREWFKKAVDNGMSLIENKNEMEWMAPMADGPIMGGLPRMVIMSGICDHTAHHRGSLSMYARMLDKVPNMPYEDPK